MKKIILLFALFYSSTAFSQKSKFGDIEKRELQEIPAANEVKAGAVVLFKSRETYFNYDEDSGWYLITEYHERLRITDQKGLQAATKKIEVYKDGIKKEQVNQIKAYTYNLEGGKVRQYALEKEWIFETDISTNRIQHSFTMPKVSVGSIVEWKYTVTSPFWKIDDLVLQQDIPVRHYHARIKTPQFFTFKVLKKGYFKIEPKEQIKQRNLYVSWKNTDSYGSTLLTSSGGTLNISEVETEFEMKNIPALKEEPFVDNIQNYRYTIVYELESTAFPNQPRKKYSNSWEEVAKAIFDFENFGDQLQDGRFLKEEVAKISDSTKSLRERMQLAFDLVKSEYTWNGKMSKYANQDLKKTHETKIGNVADINLTLILLLRECGLKVNPVLLSTRGHGKPVFPTIEGFNYVIAGVKLDDKLILLDATEKLSAPNLLPERVYNWEGRMVEENGYSQKVELSPENLSRQDVFLNYEIKEDGSIVGQMRRRFSLLEALRMRRKSHSVEDYKQSLLNDFRLDDITELDISNWSEIDNPVDEKFRFTQKNAFDKVGNTIFFSPMIFLSLTESPFLGDERQFPVNYVYPYETSYTYNIIVPDGYRIKSMPESSMITFGKSGSFKYIISEENNNIRLRVTFSVNVPVVPQEQYLDLQKYYDQRIEKENEKVVLEKKAI